MMASVTSALLKQGAPGPADVRRPSGTWLTSPSGLCELGTVAATVYCLLPSRGSFLGLTAQQQLKT
ncbi:unnamed protein product, partial [Gulo gulo]